MPEAFVRFKRHDGMVGPAGAAAGAPGEHPPAMEANLV
jgi:hypothetical protein